MEDKVEEEGNEFFNDFSSDQIKQTQKLSPKMKKILISFFSKNFPFKYNFFEKPNYKLDEDYKMEKREICYGSIFYTSCCNYSNYNYNNIINFKK